MIDKNELINLYWEEECSTLTLAIMYDVSPTTIRNWMKKKGVKRRNIREALATQRCIKKKSEIMKGKNNPGFGKFGVDSLRYEHGGTKTRLYQTWIDMKARCYYLNHVSYKNYGGRGITVYENWINDFAVFRDFALSHGYDDNLTIDRIDNDGNYDPHNCQFITRSENSKRKASV